MPAMSPTMTEGGIVEWKFKEGEAFSAGDVLLEIETDKAQIDVEAQDDGILAKIYAQNGEKGIPVGKPIGVIAEPSDDLNGLKLPSADSQESSASSAPKEVKEENKKKPEEEVISSPSSHATSTATGTTANKNQVLLPSVAGILKARGISSQEALEKITASGPNGRILKGDALAYIGSISTESVNSINETVKKLQKLDLSGIKLKEPKIEELKSKDTGADTSAASATEAAPSRPSGPTPISAVFSLTDINLLKNTLDATLSTSISVPNLVEKAVKLALRDVPKLTKPRKSILNDPLFDELLSVSPRGAKAFEYKISYPTSSRAGSVSSGDIYDILASSRKPLSSPTARISSNELLNISVTPNAKVAEGEKKAQVFLDRVGYYLAEGKGDLVL